MASSLRKEIEEVFRQAYWFARQHPGEGEGINLTELWNRQTNLILAKVREMVEEKKKKSPFYSKDMNSGYRVACQEAIAKWLFDRYENWLDWNEVGDSYLALASEILAIPGLVAENIPKQLYTFSFQEVELLKDNRQATLQEVFETLRDYLTPLSPDVDTILTVNKSDWLAVQRQFGIETGE